jgi:hypothetical protein
MVQFGVIAAAANTIMTAFFVNWAVWEVSWWLVSTASFFIVGPVWAAAVWALAWLIHRRQAH